MILLLLSAGEYIIIYAIHGVQYIIYNILTTCSRRRRPFQLCISAVYYSRRDYIKYIKDVYIHVLFFETIALHQEPHRYSFIRIIYEFNLSLLLLFFFLLWLWLCRILYLQLYITYICYVHRRNSVNYIIYLQCKRIVDSCPLIIILLKSAVIWRLRNRYNNIIVGIFSYRNTYHCKTTNRNETHESNAFPKTSVRL